MGTAVPHCDLPSAPASYTTRNLIPVLNQSQGGICMSRRCLSGLMGDGGGSARRVEGGGLGLQDGGVAPLDLVSAGGQRGEEGIDVRAHLGGGAETGVRRRLVADLVPEGLRRVEVGAVGRQADQEQSQVGGGEGRTQRAADDIAWLRAGNDQ